MQADDHFLFDVDVEINLVLTLRLISIGLSGAFTLMHPDVRSIPNTIDTVAIFMPARLASRFLFVNIVAFMDGCRLRQAERVG